MGNPCCLQLPSEPDPPADRRIPFFSVVQACRQWQNRSEIRARLLKTLRINSQQSLPNNGKYMGMLMPIHMTRQTPRRCLKCIELGMQLCLKRRSVKPANYGAGQQLTHWQKPMSLTQAEDKGLPSVRLKCNPIST